MAEPMFVGFVLGKCDMILSTYQDDIPKEVYDSLIEMRDTARKISRNYYEQDIEPPKETHLGEGIERKGKTQ